MKIKTHIIGAILLLIMLLKMPAANALTTYIFAVKVGVYIALVLWVAKHDLFAGMFFGLAVVSAIFFNGKPFTLTLFMAYAVWFLIVVNYVSDRDWLINYLIVVLILHVGFMALQVFHGDFAAMDVNTGRPLRVPTGIVSDINASSALIGILFPAMFRLRGKWKLLMLIPIFGLVLSKAFTGVLALSIGTVAYFLFIGKRREALLAIGACFIGEILFWIFIDSPGIAIRAMIYKKAAGLYATMPITGVGLGNFEVQLPFIMEHYAHNELIDYTCELGFLVPILFCGWLWTRLKSGNPIVRAGIVTSVTASMTYFTTHNPLIALVITTWVAIGVKHE